MFDLRTLDQLSKMNADDLEKVAANLQKDTFHFLEQIEECRAKGTAVRDWRAQNRREIFLYYSDCHQISDRLKCMQRKTASAILDAESGLLHRSLLPRLVQGLEGNGGLLMDEILRDIPDKTKLNQELAECLRGKLEQETADSVTPVLIACLSCVSDNGPWACLNPALDDYKRAVLVKLFDLPFQDKFLDDIGTAIRTCRNFRTSVRNEMKIPTKASDEFCSTLRKQFVESLNRKIKENWKLINPEMCRGIPIGYLNGENLMNVIKKVVPRYLKTAFSRPEPKDVLFWLVQAIFQATEVTEGDKRECGLELGRVFNTCLCCWFRKIDLDKTTLDNFCDVLGEIVLMDVRYSLSADHWILEVKKSCYSVLGDVGSELVVRALKGRSFEMFEMILEWLRIGDEPLSGSRRRIKMEILFKVIGRWTMRLPEILEKQKKQAEKEWKDFLKKDARRPVDLRSQQKGGSAGIGLSSASDLVLAWPAAVALWITQDERPWEMIVKEEFPIDQSGAWPLPALQEAMGVADLKDTLLGAREKMDNLRR